MNPARCLGPLKLTRRQLLQVGAIGAFNLSLPRLLAAEASATRKGAAARADACILIFLNGGPSHLDMWDLKPDSPSEVRGEFKPVATTVPGVQLCEHLPRLAKLQHHFALVRSVHHSVNNAHAAAVYTGLTGHDRGDANIAIGAGPNDYPAVGAMLAHLRPPPTPVVPFVSMPYITQEGRGGPPQPGFFGGWLGRSFDPLFVLRDPNAPGFGMPELTLADDLTAERLKSRQKLMTALDGDKRNAKAHLDVDAFRTKAFDLLTSPATQKAFHLDREPLPVRERYGRNVYGQSVLLARRLIEAGTRCACISWAPDANATWDTHGGNFKKLKEELLPQLDAAVGSLIADLEDRGLLGKTLVAVMGEFGRTPKINKDAGRDHWNFCYGLMLAGGGIQGGAVHGASDRIGSRPSRNPVTPADIIATIYDCLGIPADFEIIDRLQRPFQVVPWGQPIREIMA